MRKRISKTRLIKIVVRWTALFLCVFCLFTLVQQLYDVFHKEQHVVNSSNNSVATIVTPTIIPTVISINSAINTATVESLPIKVKTEAPVEKLDNTSFRGVTISPIYRMSVKMGATSTVALQIAQAYDNKTCNKHNIPADIVVGVIATESSFNPFSVSYAGAKGIMQLLPSTFRYYADQYPSIFEKRDIFNVFENTCAGLMYLSDSFQTWRSWVNNDEQAIDLAIASYLMGVQGLRKTSSNPLETVYDFDSLSKNT